jgi:hypothetical protein
VRRERNFRGAIYAKEWSKEGVCTQKLGHLDLVDIIHPGGMRCAYPGGGAGKHPFFAQ